MSGFVSEVISRKKALQLVSSALNFPWKIPVEDVNIFNSFGRRTAANIYNSAPYPPYSRSLRDGYAVRSADASGATHGTPLFLTKVGDIAMGELPSFSISTNQTAAIPTGGILPAGADSVVMIEDTDSAGGFVEIRRAVQRGDNVVFKGEERNEGDLLLPAGEIIDLKNIGMLAACGIWNVKVCALRISVLSTGDEIAPIETSELRPGTIRDINGANLCAMLSKYGFPAKYCGITNDDAESFKRRFSEELEKCDVLVLSGGSSVGVRDRSFEVLSALPEPGLLVRGINIVPGKPTLIAADGTANKLIVSLPGHPLSCVSSAFSVLMPLLCTATGAADFESQRRFTLKAAADITARTGPEEFIPCRMTEKGEAEPLPAKSGYFSALADSSGFLRIPENRETIRKGEDTEVLLWL